MRSYNKTFKHVVVYFQSKIGLGMSLWMLILQCHLISQQLLPVDTMDSCSHLSNHPFKWIWFPMMMILFLLVHSMREWTRANFIWTISLVEPTCNSGCKLLDMFQIQLDHLSARHERNDSATTYVCNYSSVLYVQVFPQPFEFGFVQWIFYASSYALVDKERSVHLQTTLP